MGKFMADDDANSSNLIWRRRFRSEKKLIVVGYASGILHRTHSEFWAENHIVFSPRTFYLEVFFIKFNTLNYEWENV